MAALDDDMRPAGRPDWPALASCAVLAAGTLAIYARTFGVPLLLDDIVSIADNPSVRRLWPIGPVLHPPAYAGDGGRPLVNLSYALNYAAGGLGVFGYHLVNVAIHILAAWVLFALVRRTLRRPLLAGRFGAAATPLALAIGAIWAWHPVQTESVTYVTQRCESLMGLFYLATLYCFVRGAESVRAGRRRGWFAACVLACLAGVGSKEVIATAPLVALLYDRTFVSGSFSAAWRRHRGLWAALAATWVPLGLLMTTGLSHRGVGFGQGIAWWRYALTESRAVVAYLGLAFWPRPLVFDYGMYLPEPAGRLAPYAAALVPLAAAALVALRRWPAAGFAGCWFFLLLAPTSSVVPLAGQPVADHRLYLPLAGVVALVVLGAFARWGRKSLLALAAAAVALGAGSVVRNRDYRSAEALWSDTVAKDPANPRARCNLGAVLEKIPGRRSEAIAQLEEAIRLKPDYAEAYDDLGVALEELPGRLGGAVADFEEAIRLKPDYADAHYDLGNALSRVPGRQADAEAELRRAIRLEPGDAEAHYNLGVVLEREPGRLPEAIAEYQAALRIDPHDVKAHNNLGNAWLKTPGRLRDAIAEFEEAIRLDPGHAAAQFNLAVALLATPGGRDEAVEHLEAYLRLRPGDERAREILAEIRAAGP